MKNKTIILLLSTLTFGISYAQTYVYSDYEWESQPATFVPEATDTFPEMFLQNKIAYEATVENGIAYEYYLHHTKTFVNSPQAIERNNRVYVPSSVSGEVLKLKVRVIKPKGEVVLMNDNDIKEATDEGKDRKYKYMAVRGLENGSVVEELFVTKTPSDFTGRVYTVQSEYPTRNCTFEIIYPDYCIFDIKTYNGFPKLEKDSTYNEQGRTCYKTIASYIPPLKEEKYANRTAHTQKVAYKLTGSRRTGKLNINSFDNISDVIFQRINKQLSKTEEKALDKIITDAQLTYTKNEEDKIRKFEDYVKNTIYVTEGLPNYSVSIDKILETKMADEASVTRLYAVAFDKMNIRCELLLTCSHYDYTFERNFESFNYLDKYFLFFPQYTKYLAPSYPLYRYGLIPPQFRNNNGLFIKKTTLGNLTTGLGIVKFVDPDTYSINTDSLDVDVDFSEGFENVKFNYRVSISGQDATSVQGIFDYLKEEKDKDELRKSLIERYADDEEIKEIKSENEGCAFVAKKPYGVSGSFTSNKFIDKAGAKYLFKVGELIGPQEQLYQEESRKMPMEMSYCKNYRHTITFEIPKGFKLTNIEKLDMNISLKDKSDNPVMAFRSWYDIKDNKVTVNVEEYYKVTNLPIERYEEFRTVINASADFNKIVLLFEPL